MLRRSGCGPPCGPPAVPASSRRKPGAAFRTAGAMEASCSRAMSGPPPPRCLVVLLVGFEESVVKKLPVPIVLGSDEPCAQPCFAGRFHLRVSRGVHQIEEVEERPGTAIRDQLPDRRPLGRRQLYGAKGMVLFRR